MGAISALQQQVQSLQAELNLLRGEILKYKLREAANINMNMNMNMNNMIPSSHQLAMLPSNSSVDVSIAAPPPPPPPPPLPSTTSNSSSSIYFQQRDPNYSTISSDDNISYFG
jgi:hypothetical protein